MKKDLSGFDRDSTSRVLHEYGLLKEAIRIEQDHKPFLGNAIKKITNAYCPSILIFNPPNHYFEAVGLNLAFRTAMSIAAIKADLRASKKQRAALSRFGPAAIFPKETMTESISRHALAIARDFSKAERISGDLAEEICVTVLNVMGKTVDGRSDITERFMHLRALVEFRNVIDDIDTLSQQIINGERRPTPYEKRILFIRDGAERLLLEHEGTTEGRTAIRVHESTAYKTNRPGLELFRDKIAFKHQLRKTFANIPEDSKLKRLGRILISTRNLEVPAQTTMEIADSGISLPDPSTTIGF